MYKILEENPAKLPQDLLSTMARTWSVCQIQLPEREKVLYLLTVLAYDKGINRGMDMASKTWERKEG